MADQFVALYHVQSEVCYAKVYLDFLGYLIDFPPSFRLGPNRIFKASGFFFFSLSFHACCYEWKATPQASKFATEFFPHLQSPINGFYENHISIQWIIQCLHTAFRVQIFYATSFEERFSSHSKPVSQYLTIVSGKPFFSLQLPLNNSEGIFFFSKQPYTNDEVTWQHEEKDRMSWIGSNSL